jgi:hypothetical protein
MLRLGAVLAFCSRNAHIEHSPQYNQRLCSSFFLSSMPDHTKNIHERFLRHIWSRQYLDQSRLRTCDGRLLKVIEVGKLNLDGGPDFADAKIKIGITTFVGDVEIHRTVSDWFSHQHQNDPKYNRVILHVVLQRGAPGLDTTSLSGRTIPVLVLSDFLAESIQSIWQKAILDERARTSERIQCWEKNANISDALLAGWLKKLATERIELKLRRFEERLKELAFEQIMTVREHPKTYGDPAMEGFPDEIPPPFKEFTQNDFAEKELWEQVLYEGLMEGLGYSKNRDPFLRLARSATLRNLRDQQLVQDESKRAAFLFAVAGLLPKIKSMGERESKEYVRGLIRAWNTMRSSVRIAKLRASDWQFFPTRPNNFPTLRISAANKLIGKLLNEELFRAVIQVFKSADLPAVSRQRLAGLLAVESDQFWRHHYDFDQSTGRTMVALGQSRINDLIINTVIPVTLLYARIFKDSEVREHVLQLYQEFPPADENTVTRLMDRQLIRKRMHTDYAWKQQGLIQLYKFYCTGLRCDDCDVGRTVFARD